jgi:hypothetical protein
VGGLTLALVVRAPDTHVGCRPRALCELHLGEIIEVTIPSVEQEGPETWCGLMTTRAGT